MGFTVIVVLIVYFVTTTTFDCELAFMLNVAKYGRI